MKFPSFALLFVVTLVFNAPRLIETCFADDASSSANFQSIGDRVNAHVKDGVAITQGVIRVRRRHENDMDFSKYNPFYWKGRLTRFRIEDHTPSGKNKIKFTLLTEWPQDYTKYRGPDFSAIYIGDPLAHETERSKFAINARMKHVADYKHFEYTMEAGTFRAFEKQLKPGELVTIEYRFFNDEAHGPWKKQKERNPANLSAYYSEFFRFRIGEPGIYIDNLQTPNAHPSPKRYAGGWTTIPTVRVEPWRALQQQAFNLTWEKGEAFLRGRTWFHTDLKTGKHISDRSDDKPSVFFKEMEEQRERFVATAYNATSCNSCHKLNSGDLLPFHADNTQPIHTTIVKTLDAKTGEPHSVFGNQLQTDGVTGEGDLKLSRFKESEVQLNDGTYIRMLKPVFTIKSPHQGSEPALSPRRTPAIIGVGLLEAVPDETILAMARESKGKANIIRSDGGAKQKIGRFGWKASQPTVRDQIKDALLNDMGVMSDGKDSLDTRNVKYKARPGKAKLPKQAIDELEAYVALLGVPPRDNPEDPKVLAGERIFHALKCHTCHTPTLRTGASHHKELQNQTIHPYTDLLLHDMGDGLADDGQFTNEKHAKTARLWRTAPLWGLKNTRDANDDLRKKFRPADTNVTYAQTREAAKKNRIQLLHDGRARSIAEAILWHGGEAEESVKRYKALSKQDRALLEAFLWDL